MKKYHEITILHVLSCCMILLCHFFQDAKIGSLGEIFLSGLSLFFIISGFLTGLKPSYDFRWLKSRFKRILVPYYIIIGSLLLILYLFSNEFRFGSALHLATATQGLNYFIWPYHGYGAMTGLGHLWYVTIILLCFIFTPSLEWAYKKWAPSLKSIYKFLVILICVLQPILVLIGVQISYIVSFLIGFFIARNGYLFNTKRWLWVMGIFVFTSVIRFLGMRFIDGTIIYDRYIALVSQGSLAVAIFATMFYIGSINNGFILKIGKNKIIVFLASIIYEIYLLHYFFLRGLWPIKEYVGNIFVADLLVAVLSICVGYIVSRSYVKRLKS